MTHEVTNEMIDRLMGELVPSFCYRDAEVTKDTQRIGFFQAGGNSYLTWYGWDGGLLFCIEDDGFGPVERAKYQKLILSKFNAVAKIAMQEFGMMIHELNPMDKLPSLHLYYPEENK